MGQQEDRYGDKVKGSYWVNLPNGKKQIVNYYVDEYSGFVADISYEGGNAYSAPAYQQESYKSNYDNSYKPSYNSYKSSY